MSIPVCGIVSFKTAGRHRWPAAAGDDLPERQGRSGLLKKVNHDTDVNIHTETTKLLMKNCPKIRNVLCSGLCVTRHMSVIHQMFKRSQGVRRCNHSQQISAGLLAKIEQMKPVHPHRTLPLRSSEYLQQSQHIIVAHLQLRNKRASRVTCRTMTRHRDSPAPRRNQHGTFPVPSPRPRPSHLAYPCRWPHRYAVRSWVPALPLGARATGCESERARHRGQMN